MRMDRAPVPGRVQMNPEPEHLFWAKRWKAAHDLCKRWAHPWPGVPDLAETNYMLYLVHVFSWLFDQKEKVK